MFIFFGQARRRNDANGRSHQWQPPSPLLVVHSAQGEEGAAAASPNAGRGDRLSGTCLWSWTTAPQDDGGSRVVHSGRELHRWPRLQWTRLHLFGGIFNPAIVLGNPRRTRDNMQEIALAKSASYQVDVKRRIG